MFSFLIFPLFLMVASTLGSPGRYHDPTNAEHFAKDFIKIGVSLPKVKRELFNTPDEIDYRIQGLVTPVKEVHEMGGRIYYVAIETIEGAYAQKKNISAVALSVDQALDCTHLPPKSNIMDIIEAMAEQGCETEDDYGGGFYVPGNCYYDASKVTVHVTKGIQIKTPDVEGLKKTLKLHCSPLGITFYMSDQMQRYQGGVISPTDCEGYNPNFAALLVGYRTEYDSGKTYWIIKTSLGAEYGDNGYLYLDVQSPCSVLTNGATSAEVSLK